MHYGEHLEPTLGYGRCCDEVEDQSVNATVLSGLIDSPPLQAERKAVVTQGRMRPVTGPYCITHNWVTLLVSALHFQPDVFSLHYPFVFPSMFANSTA